MEPFAILSFWLGFLLLAWWPGRMPRTIRKAATGLALTPILVAFLFLLVVLIRRPNQIFWAAGPILVVLGTMISAGAYSMWPGDAPRRNRAVAALFFLGPFLGLLILAVTVALARGGTVTGTVTFTGQPLPSGKVLMMSEKGAVCTGEIQPGGRFWVYRVPPGLVKTAVATYPPPPPGPVPIAASKYIRIPRRYRDFDKSTLRFTVKHGGQVQNIDLEP